MKVPREKAANMIMKEVEQWETQIQRLDTKKAKSKAKTKFPSVIKKPNYNFRVDDKEASKLYENTESMPQSNPRRSSKQGIAAFNNNLVFLQQEKPSALKPDSQIQTLGEHLQKMSTFKASTKEKKGRKKRKSNKAQE